MIEKSIITCPHCAHQAVELMPKDTCQFFYVCKGCGQRLKPLPGDLLRILFVRLSAVPASPRVIKLLWLRIDFGSG